MSLTVIDQYPFGPQDYRHMKFNVMTADPKKSYIEQFPELGRFKSFLDVEKLYKTKTNSIIKYICLCYDRMSPAQTQIADIFKRKSWCGAVAGFTYNAETTIFDPDDYKILNGEINEVNYAIIDFASLFNSPEYLMLVTAWESFYSKQRKINQFVSMEGKDVLAGEKIRGDLYKQLKDMAADINSLSISYLKDNNLYLQQDLYRLVLEEVRKRLLLTPELRAKARKEKNVKVH